MSDYMPNNPDPNRDPRYYEPTGGKGLTLVVGVLVVLALVAGLLFFTGTSNRNEVAERPDAPIATPTDQPRTPAMPPRAPATPPAANPTAPANPQQ